MVTGSRPQNQANQVTIRISYRPNWNVRLEHYVNDYIEANPEGQRGMRKEKFMENVVNVVLGETYKIGC